MTYYQIECTSKTKHNHTYFDMFTCVESDLVEVTKHITLKLKRKERTLEQLKVTKTPNTAGQTPS